MKKILIDYFKLTDYVANLIIAGENPMLKLETLLMRSLTKEEKDMLNNAK